MIMWNNRREDDDDHNQWAEAREPFWKAYSEKRDALEDPASRVPIVDTIPHEKEVRMGYEISSSLLGEDHPVTSKYLAAIALDKFDVENPRPGYGDQSEWDRDGVIRHLLSDLVAYLPEELYGDVMCHIMSKRHGADPEL